MTEVVPIEFLTAAATPAELGLFPEDFITWNHDVLPCAWILVDQTRFWSIQIMVASMFSVAEKSMSYYELYLDLTVPQELVCLTMWTFSKNLKALVMLNNHF